jgi:hypothetical protein
LFRFFGDGTGFGGPFVGAICFAPGGVSSVPLASTHGVVLPGAVVAGNELGGFACGSAVFGDFASLSLLTGLQVEESDENWLASLGEGGLGDVSLFGC